MLPRIVRAVTAPVMCLALVVVAVPVFVFASPASAAGAATCPDWLTPTKTLFGPIPCYNSAGDYEGYIGSNGYVSAETALVGTEVEYPSSVMASGVGASTTTAEASGLATMDAGLIGSSTDSGAIVAVADAPGVGAYAGTVVAGGFIGYMIGKQVDSVACKFGLGSLCTPSVNPSYVANADSVAVQAGFDPQSATGTLTTGSYPYTPTITASHTGTDPAAGTTATVSPSTILNLVMSYTGTAPTGSPGQSVSLGSELLCGTAGAQSQTSAAGPEGRKAIGSTGTYPVFDSQGRTPGSQYTIPLTRAYPSSCSSAQGGAQGVAVFMVESPKEYEAVYWFPGSSFYTPGQTANPTRKLETDNTCTLTSDGTTTSIQSAQSSQSYDDAGLQAGTEHLPAFPMPSQCPAGTTLTASKLYSLIVSSGTKTLISTLTVPSAVTSWRSTYPQCVNGVCRLGLYRSTPNGLVKCFTDSGLPDDACADWFTDPTKSNDYTCTYGVSDSTADATVALSECNVYAPTFKKSKQAQGIIYANPKTGEYPGNLPIVAPANAPGGSAFNSNPGTNPTPAPVTTPVTTPLPGQSGNSCWPSGYSQIFNPLEWVLKPVECALTWAFVPDPSVISGTLSDTWTTLENRPPVSVVYPLVSSITGFFGAALTGSCSGTIADFGHALTVPCDPPPAVKTPLHVIYVLMQISVAVAGAFGVWKVVEDGVAVK